VDGEQLGYDAGMEPIRRAYTDGTRIVDADGPDEACLLLGQPIEDIRLVIPPMPDVFSLEDVAAWWARVSRIFDAEQNRARDVVECVRASAKDLEARLNQAHIDARLDRAEIERLWSIIKDREAEIRRLKKRRLDSRATASHRVIRVRDPMPVYLL
jgi:hypothetical protein